MRVFHGLADDFTPMLATSHSPRADIALEAPHARHPAWRRRKRAIVIRILLLGLVLAGVYYLYRMVTQQKPSLPDAANDATPIGSAAPEPAAEAAAEDAPAKAAEAEPAPTAAAPEPALAEAAEMIECPLCQAYVPETAHDGCGRPGCPIPALAADRAR
jgi:hypothetical protein